jgi:hypothetical protein
MAPGLGLTMRPTVIAVFNRKFAKNKIIKQMKVTLYLKTIKYSRKKSSYEKKFNVLHVDYVDADKLFLFTI